MGRRTRWFAVVMGVVLIALGVAETVRAVRSGDGGLAFWFPTLVGGGSLILGGVYLAERSPVASRILTVLGCLAGILPTMWTIVIPVLLVTLAVLRLRHAPAAAAASDSPGEPRGVTPPAG